MVAQLLIVSAWVPMAPALAASSCWFGAPASRSGALPACGDPDLSLDLIGRFHLQLITLPFGGATLALVASSLAQPRRVRHADPLRLGSPVTGPRPRVSGLAVDRCH